MEMRMVVDDGSEPAKVDTGLVRVLVRGFAIRDQLFNDHSLTLNDVAEREGIVPSYATRLFRLSFLAPDIVATILDGRHPPELTVRKLLDDTRLPLDWSEQRARLGFAQRVGAAARVVSVSLSRLLPHHESCAPRARRPYHRRRRRETPRRKRAQIRSETSPPNGSIPAPPQASEMSLELRRRQSQIILAISIT